MTRHPVDESLAKCQMPLEETNKIIEGNLRLLNDNPLHICSSPAIEKEEAKRTVKIASVKTRTNVTKNRMGKIMHKLYDIEPVGKPEKRIDIDFNVDIYQMEDW